MGKQGYLCMSPGPTNTRWAAIIKPPFKKGIFTQIAGYIHYLYFLVIYINLYIDYTYIMHILYLHRLLLV